MEKNAEDPEVYRDLGVDKKEVKHHHCQDPCSKVRAIVFRQVSPPHIPIGPFRAASLVQYKWVHLSQCNGSYSLECAKLH